VPSASTPGRAQLTPCQPKVVSDTDDAELKELMERFEAQNMDVAGDDDESEEDE
jgi:translation initiation factor 2 subunit 1